WQMLNAYRTRIQPSFRCRQVQLQGMLAPRVCLSEGPPRGAISHSTRELGSMQVAQTSTSDPDLRSTLVIVARASLSLRLSTSSQASSAPLIHSSHRS